jgi:di/tricarboxylate transporter
MQKGMPMTPDMFIVFAVLVVAVVLFATEKLPVDLVAILVMSVLLVAGIITPEEGIAGFSNTATVIVGVMFIISAGLLKTGAVNAFGAVLAALGKGSIWVNVLIIMGIMGVTSSFMSNTAAVAVFIPIVIGMAKRNRISISKLLMPMSFASMFGGTCTLIGTSTNILVSSIAETHGQKPFGMFEFTPLGLIFFLAGLVYMFFFGARMIPDRRGGGDLTDAFAMEEYLTEVILHAEAKSVGKTVRDAPIVHDLDLAILSLRRNGILMGLPEPDTVLMEGDVLLVRCNVEKIRKLEEREGVSLKPKLPLRDSDLNSEQLIPVFWPF